MYGVIFADALCAFLFFSSAENKIKMEVFTSFFRTFDEVMLANGFLR